METAGSDGGEEVVTEDAAGGYTGVSAMLFESRSEFGKETFAEEADSAGLKACWVDETVCEVTAETSAEQEQRTGVAEEREETATAEFATGASGCCSCFKSRVVPR